MLKRILSKKKKASGPVKRAKTVFKAKPKAKKPVMKRVKAKTKLKAARKTGATKTGAKMKKTAAKARPKLKPKAAAIAPITMTMGQPKEVGRVTHFFDHINVAVIELSSALRQGDQIEIRGAATELTQRAGSMQIDHLPVSVAQAGESIGLKVAGKVREGDRVYRLG